MNVHINRIIEEYEYPIINSLIYANGDMLVLESYKIANKHILRILCKSNIDSYFAYNDLSYVSSIAVSVSEENEDYLVLAGGGSMGGDGIIFIIDKQTEKPLWFLFLDNSDPFNDVIFESDSNITLCSTGGLKISICITNPENMKVHN